jgi:hypothetical protein
MIDLLLIDSVYFVWLLVPLVPAIALYLIFPTGLVEAQWNISGIAVKATGATGLYLTLIGLSYIKFLSPSLEYVKTLRPPYWTVEAPIKFLDSDQKDIPASTTSSEQFKVHPFAYDFSKIDEKRYLVTLKFWESSNGQLPATIRLIFAEGEGFIDLKKLKTKENTDVLAKKIDLTDAPPTLIRPPLSGGQNKPVVAGLPKKLERDLESGDRGR